MLARSTALQVIASVCSNQVLAYLFVGFDLLCFERCLEHTSACMDTLIQQDAWLASDEPIGPGNSRIFDFTLVFENSFLSILPAAILLLIAPLHVWRNTRGAKVASTSSLYWARLVRTRFLGRDRYIANIL